jgi:hypothetical protein
VSSAYTSTVELGMFGGRSFMKARKRRGPRMILEGHHKLYIMDMI